MCIIYLFYVFVKRTNQEKGHPGNQDLLRSLDKQTQKKQNKNNYKTLYFTNTLKFSSTKTILTVKIIIKKPQHLINISTIYIYTHTHFTLIYYPPCSQLFSYSKFTIETNQKNGSFTYAVLFLGFIAVYEQCSW